jgi:hypothetical protein
VSVKGKEAKRQGDEFRDEYRNYVCLLSKRASVQDAEKNRAETTKQAREALESNFPAPISFIGCRPGIQLPPASELRFSYQQQLRMRQRDAFDNPQMSTEQDRCDLDMTEILRSNTMIGGAFLAN